MICRKMEVLKINEAADTAVESARVVDPRRWNFAIKQKVKCEVTRCLYVIVNQRQAACGGVELSLVFWNFGEPGDVLPVEPTRSGGAG